MNTLLASIVFLSSIILLAQGCARDKAVVEAVVEQPLALADNPQAHLSETMQRLRGRWVLEVADPREPNPTTMRLFAISDNTLSGRLNFAGPFDDTGVAATLVQSGEVFTLTLVDDDLRQHDNFPKHRVYTGAFSATTNTLSLKSDTGTEDLKFEIPGGYGLKFSGNVYRCVMIHTPDTPTPAPGAGTTPGGVTPPGGVVTPPATPTPGGGTNPGGGSGWGHTLTNQLVQIDSVRPPSAPANPGNGTQPVPSHTPAHPTPSPTPTPTPTPGAEVPKARLTTCGVLSSENESWSRMSGTGGQ